MEIFNPIYHPNSDSESDHSVADASEDRSSHGTIEEFCETYQCRICNYIPDSATAQIFYDIWTTESFKDAHQ